MYMDTSLLEQEILSSSGGLKNIILNSAAIFYSAILRRRKVLSKSHPCLSIGLVSCVSDRWVDRLVH